MTVVGGSGWLAAAEGVPGQPTLRCMRDAHLLRSMRTRLSREMEWTLECIDLWLGECRRPYVAYSGGKDSTVVLHAIRSVRPDIEAILWIDKHGAMPGVLEMVAWWRDQGAIVHVHEHGSLAASIARTGEPVMDLGGALQWAFDQGFDGAARGLRAEESRGRQMHAVTRHSVRERWPGHWETDPIIWWRADDVWAYHALHGLPYCALYDIDDGQPRNNRRVGEPLGMIGDTYGRVARLKQHHHALFQRLASVAPEMRNHT